MIFCRVIRGVVLKSCSNVHAGMRFQQAENYKKLKDDGGGVDGGREEGIRIVVCGMGVARVSNEDSLLGSISSHSKNFFIFPP